MEYKIGMVVKGQVAGIQPYGIFVSLDKQTQGLIHISELQHGFVQSIEETVSINDELDVMVLDVDEYTKKISLSVRTMAEPKRIKRYARNSIARYGEKKNIGFRSLGENLPKWVEEAKKDEREKTQ